MSLHFCSWVISHDYHSVRIWKQQELQRGNAEVVFQYHYKYTGFNENVIQCLTQERNPNRPCLSSKQTVYKQISLRNLCAGYKKEHRNSFSKSEDLRSSVQQTENKSAESKLDQSLERQSLIHTGYQDHVPEKKDDELIYILRKYINNSTAS